MNERQKSSRRFPITLPSPLLKRNRQPTVHQDNTASGQQQGGHGNQSSHNSSADAHAPHPFMQPPPTSGSSYSTSAPGPAIALSAVSNAAGSAAMASGIVAGGQRANAARSTADPQGYASAAASQPSGSGSGEVTRKKGPRELTSFPPYTSPQSERGDPLPPPRASGLVTSERPPQQGQGHGDKAAPKPEPAAAEETGSSEGQSAPRCVDYGPAEPLQPIAEGWSLTQCSVEHHTGHPLLSSSHPPPTPFFDFHVVF